MWGWGWCRLSISPQWQTPPLPLRQHEEGDPFHAAGRGGPQSACSDLLSDSGPFRDGDGSTWPYGKQGRQRSVTVSVKGKLCLAYMKVILSYHPFERDKRRWLLFIDSENCVDEGVWVTLCQTFPDHMFVTLRNSMHPADLSTLLGRQSMLKSGRRRHCFVCIDCDGFQLLNYVRSSLWNLPGKAGGCGCCI